METRLRMLVVLAGLPEPVINLEVRDEDGEVLRKYDLAYPVVKVAVEFNGKVHVLTPEAWEADLERRDASDDDGWRLLPVVSSGIYAKPAETLARIHRVLLARGLPGTPLRLGDAWRARSRSRRRCMSTCGGCGPSNARRPATSAARAADVDPGRSPGRTDRPLSPRHGHLPPHGADSEVGRLATVMLHRPGNELQAAHAPQQRPRSSSTASRGSSRAQEEHDAFAETLRDRGVEVLYLTELLTETLDGELARNHAITSALSGAAPRRHDARATSPACATWPPSSSPTCSPPGIRNDEVRGGHGLVTSLLDPHDFLVDPLPNLLFTRDSSVWVQDRVAVTSLAMPARKRETQLTELIYTEHPRFAGTR